MTYRVRCAYLIIALGLLLMPALLFAEGASGQCDSAFNACKSRGDSGCEQQWQGCMSKCNVGGGAVGSCNKDPECQLHCTESATSQGGRLSCCEGGPKHQNSCPNKVDGNCEPKKTEGGEGKMPELPKPPQGCGGGEPKPEEQCEKNATTTKSGQPCPEKTSGVSDYLSGIFSTGSTSTVVGSVQSTLSSAADKLSSFLFGNDTKSTTKTSGGASENTGTPTVPSGGTQLAPQVVQATPIGSSSENAGAPSAVVTGFGQNTSSAEQSGIIKAIGETLSGIGVTLRNLLSSFAF